MFKSILIVSAISLVTFVVVGVLSPTAAGSGEPAPARALVCERFTAEQSVVKDIHESARASYVLAVMNDWPHANVPVASYEDIAKDIADATTNASDAVLLATLGYWEGARFARSVDDGSCNSKAWRTDPANAKILHITGNCDGGLAHSIFQIHPIVSPSSRLYSKCNLEAISTRLGAAKCAIALAQADVSLCSYAGESLALGCPKAELRVNFALRALAKHHDPDTFGTSNW